MTVLVVVVAVLIGGAATDNIAVWVGGVSALWLLLFDEVELILAGRC